MNRRNFFKVISGFIAGVFAGSTKTKAKDKLKCGGQDGTLCPRCKFNYPELDAQKYLGTEFICNALCNCFEQKMELLDNGVMVYCPHRQPYIITKDGEIVEDFSKSQWVSFSDTNEKWHFLVSDYYGGDKRKLYIDGKEVV